MGDVGIGPLDIVIFLYDISIFESKWLPDPPTFDNTVCSHASICGDTCAIVVR